MQLVKNSMEFTESASGVGTGFSSNIAYLPGVDRWYAFVDNSGNVDLYDSADGVTWSAANNETYSMLIAGNFVENAGTVYTPAGSSGISSSSTGLAANFSPETNTFANLTTVHRVIYDAVNGLFLAGGGAGANADIESATAMGGTWTQRYTATGDIYGMAHDPVNGITVAFENGALEYVYSSNGTTWTTDTAPTASAWNVFYNAALGKFVFHLSGGGTQKLGFTTDGTDYFEIDFGGGNPFGNILNTPVGIFAFEQHGTAVEKCYHLTGVAPGLPEFFTSSFFEFNAASADDVIQTVSTIGTAAYDCGGFSTSKGQEKLVWRYNTSLWANAKY